jgi:hypothetical protein
MDVFLFYFLNSIFSHKGRKIIMPLRKRELGFLGINPDFAVYDYCKFWVNTG